jgi:hypothetical protein
MDVKLIKKFEFYAGSISVEVVVNKTNNGYIVERIEKEKGQADLIFDLFFIDNGSLFDYFLSDDHYVLFKKYIDKTW